MRIGKSARIAFAATLTACSLLVAPATAQTTTMPGGTGPFNNTSGGAIASRRPGTWIQSGIATHSQRQAAALHAFGGAHITQQEPTDFRDEVLPQLVNLLLGAIQALSTAIQAAIQTSLAGS